jgi:hypothetical protein|tara:strand:+ start:177 stop:449 length:273 start_codon:yes stop_codon:yes gene_type:complete
MERGDVDKTDFVAYNLNRCERLLAYTRGIAASSVKHCDNHLIFPSSRSLRTGEGPSVSKTVSWNGMTHAASFDKHRRGTYTQISSHKYSI